MTEPNVKRVSTTASLPLTAMGLMSGTSLDGMDAALIQTDGQSRVEILDTLSQSYSPEQRRALRSVLGQSSHSGEVKKTEEMITAAHAGLVADLIEKSGITPDIIGFHGQTLFHDPQNGKSLQIGDGELLARKTGLMVINDFRSADMEAGGQGAPFLPLYHQALLRSADIDLPAVVVNLGGVANFTWLGPEEDHLLAFDTGPASALIDDWVYKTCGLEYDKDGALAAKGNPDQKRVEKWLEDPFFKTRPPKSLDRDHWKKCDVSDLSPEDGAATLTEFTIRSIEKAASHFPAPAQHWYASGGGRRNSYLMKKLEHILRPAHLHKIESLGWDGDFIEAQGFAYLAVRAQTGLPLSLPGTTGCKSPVSGGQLHHPPENNRNSS